MQNKDPQFIGSRLLDRGFRVWFLYLFRFINGTPFIEQPLHKQLFEQIERMLRREDNRLCINLAPRSGKTTLNMWMVVYILTVNPKAHIIYTSFNQDLLRQIAEQVASIMSNPIYQAMYGRTFVSETEETDPIDDFWKDWLFHTTGKLKFSSRKITTPNGGVVLFSSIGSAITGFGAGLRHPIDNLPDGGLFIDDADKPTDVRSERIRQKTHIYFQETLLSRLNNSNTVISNTQQRLHLDDMTGFLVNSYGFKVFKFPLIAEDGTCNLGNQYTPERIKELQVDKYTFSAQYQQEPIILGGGVIKHEWWRFYKDMYDCAYRRIFITADTAMKTKEWNDFTAIEVWGLTNTNRLRLLDMVHGKFEIPELEQVMVSLWEKWKMGIGTCRCSSIIIEDKASGTQLIQTLMRKGGLPIQRVIPEKDKYTRVQNAIPQLAAGNVELPENDLHPLSKILIDEADAFTADDSHLHDDTIDAFCYAVDSAFNSRGII
ncbi:MAG: phage terminase large subunit [Bacteroidales bacterium]|nr:phage terminase large subunit [Bacteroidales bacterium]